MKTLLIGGVVVAFALFLAPVGMAFDPPNYTPGAGIKDTVHDLGTSHNGMDYTANPEDPLNRICIFCHTPHHSYKLAGVSEGTGPNAPDGFDYLPLWNHEPSTNWGSYTMYTSGPGAPTVGSKALQAVLDQPGGTSMLCLSCHDGSIAVNSYGNDNQPEGSRSLGGGPTISPLYQIGKDNYLGNHHPIGFNYYDAYPADTEIRSPDTLLVGSTTITDHLYGSGNTQLECGSCHSVHNTGNQGETLLWRSDQNSELCLTCHAKAPYTDAPEAPPAP